MTSPARLGPEQTEAERALWRIVRLDSLLALPGLILKADEMTGEAVMRQPAPDGKTADVTYALGAGGIAIIRGR